VLPFSTGELRSQVLSLSTGVYKRAESVAEPGLVARLQGAALALEALSEV
jgi:hypothetical protein